MKKNIFLLISVLFCMSMSAKDLTGVKIYINPGHGGYNGANDRNVLTIPYALGDTLGFWESSSNFTKGVELTRLLRVSGATVIMSRWLNREEDDRVLTEIGEEANANNADAFLSIHSNAVGVNKGTNYLLLLYRGTDTEPDPSAGKPMAQACWPRMFDNPLSPWTFYSLDNQNVRGDFSFYGYHLGVLKNTTVPGFLSEGSFHDYAPEAHRLLNTDYRKLEAARFYRYYCDYFGAELPKKGIIAGFVKGKEEQMINPIYVYKTGTDDEWLPLNKSKVTLQSTTGEELGVYNVDTLYNGIFTFFDLAPGTYKLVFEAADHKKEEKEVTVTAGATAYVKAFLENTTNPPVRPIPDDYPAPVQEAGVLNQPFYKFAESWNFTEGGASNPEWLNPSLIKKVLYANKQLYVLTTEPRIVIVNPATGAKISEMNLTGIEGGVKTISDINFTADGYLLACNKDTVTLPADSRSFKVYYWENDAAAPALFFSTQQQGNFSVSVIGETFAVSGPLWKCRIYTPAITTGSSKQIRVIGFLKDEKAPVLGYQYMRDDSYTEMNWGKNMTFNVSPQGEMGRIIIDGENILPTEYLFDWKAPDRNPLVKKGELSADLLKKESTGLSFFKYAGHSYMVAANVKAGKTNAVCTLFNINDGLDNAVKVSDVLPSEGLGANETNLLATAARVNGYDMELYLLAQNQGMARYVSQTGDVIANIYASGLKSKEVTDGFELHFLLNEAATAVRIDVLDGEEVVKTFEAGEMPKGAQTFNVTNADLPNGTYSWRVTATAGSVVRPVKITDDTKAQMQFFGPQGVAVDNHFESPSFGQVYVSESKGGVVTGGRTTQNGIYILDPTFEDVTKQGAKPYTGGETWGVSSSPFRLCVAPDGMLFMSDWSDNHSGVWIMDPTDPMANFTSVFGGTRDATGLVSEGGVKIHGSNSHCAVLGTGEDRVLYIFDEDYTDAVATAKGNILQYNIGNLTAPWAAAPSAIVYNNAANGKLELNMNSSIAPDGRGGWWISQYRATDEVGVPSLIHIGTDGRVNFNSGKTPALLENSVQGGMAVSPDGTRLAMGCNDEIKVMDVVYSEEGVPTLTRLYSIKPGLGKNSNSVTFDCAGNVYLVSNTKERMGAWALPKADNSFTTPAPTAQKFEITMSTVDIENTELVPMNVYPNPTRGDIRIESSVSPIRSVMLFDMSGRMLWKLTGLESNSETIDMSAYSNGMYLLKVNNQTIKVTKE